MSFFSKNIESTYLKVEIKEDEVHIRAKKGDGQIIYEIFKLHNLPEIEKFLNSMRSEKWDKEINRLIALLHNSRLKKGDTIVPQCNVLPLKNMSGINNTENEDERGIL